MVSHLRRRRGRLNHLNQPGIRAARLSRVRERLKVTGSGRSVNSRKAFLQGPAHGLDPVIVPGGDDAGDELADGVVGHHGGATTASWTPWALQESGG